MNATPCAAAPRCPDLATPRPSPPPAQVEFLRMGSLKSGLTRLRKQGADISRRLRVAIALQVGVCVCVSVSVSVSVFCGWVG